MKVRIVQTLIAISASLLVAYGFYSFSRNSNLLLAGGSFVFLAVTLISAVGMKSPRERTSTLIRVTAGIFAAIAMTSNLVFSFMSTNVPLYVIVNGILLLAFFLIAYSIYRSKQ
jgi:tetrahydromethanopterin S-methyltransferase subunit C